MEEAGGEPPKEVVEVILESSGVIRTYVDEQVRGSQGRTHRAWAPKEGREGEQALSGPER